MTQATENSDIVAVWSVGSYTFTQTISLANDSSNEHGMVSISLSATNSSGSNANIKARVLWDTALGGYDFGTYQAVDEESVTHAISTEQILDGTDYPIPQNFYCLDNVFDPAITAYSVNSPQAMPYQAAFGHWNNLAASLFDFVPDSSMDFTKTQNDYLTADSAYALYYDLGSVGSTPVSMVTYYGVYSHKDVSAAEKMTVDVSAPLRLTLNDAGDGYVRQTDQGVADFAAGVTFENYASDTAQDYQNLSLVVRTTENLRSLGDMGAENNSQFGSTDPFIITYADVKVGDINSKTLYFQAKVTDTAAYERITIGIYDTSETQGAIVEEKKLGEQIAYILLPGADGSIPKVSFTEMTPKVIYSSGTRHLYVTVKNPALLDNRGNWNLVARSVDGKTSHTILYRADGRPQTNSVLKFDDVAEDAYYADAVCWASENGIITGVSDGKFAPDQNMTREEIAAVMSRYADYKGIHTASQGDLTVFADADAVSGWARESVAWAVDYGLLSGKENNLLDPRGDTTRAEAAAILERFLEQ